MAALKALIVDDSKLARISISRMLQKLDVESDMVSSGREAIEYLELIRESAGQLPDVIFMDHTMPDMDGFQTVQKIKSDSATADIPVVMCTGNEGDAFVKEAEAIGALSTLSKPPVPDKLQQILTDLEDARTAVQEEIEPEISMEQIQEIAKSTAEESARQTVEAMFDTALDARVEAAIRAVAERLESRLSDLISSAVSEEGKRIGDELNAANSAQFKEFRNELLALGETSAREFVESEFDTRVEAAVGASVAEIRSSVSEDAKSTAEALVAARLDEMQQQTPDTDSQDEEHAREFIESELNSRVETAVAASFAENQQRASAEAASAANEAVEARLDEMKQQASTSPEPEITREFIESELASRIEVSVGEGLAGIQEKAAEEAKSATEAVIAERLGEMRESSQSSAESGVAGSSPASSANAEIQQVRMMAIGAGVVGILAALLVYLLR